MTITKNYITLLGLTDDRRKVVLADNRGNKEGASNNGFVLIVNATGFTMMNLTLVNYCNLDYEYPGDPSKNLKMRSAVITQAVALQAQGDKHVYSHVAVLSRLLDTTFIRTTRSYFTHVYIRKAPTISSAAVRLAFGRTPKFISPPATASCLLPRESPTPQHPCL